MDRNHCREFSRRCIALANRAIDGEQSTLFEMAAAWLQLAIELEADPVFQERMRKIRIFPVVEDAATART